MTKIYVYVVFLAGFMCFSVKSYAQDIHFSQFTAAPLMLNPALSGLNGCDYRMAAVFKGQWGSISANKTFTYRTVYGSYDMAIFKRAKYESFGGIGLSVYSDQAGDANFSTNKVDVSAAYHLVLDKTGRQSLSFGLQGGMGHRSIDQSQLYFDTQFDPDFGFDPQGPGELIERDKFFFGDMAAGVIWNFSPNEKSNYYVGVSASHLNQPNLSFQNTPSEKLYIKYGSNGGALIGLTEKLELMPSYVLMIQGPAHQFTLGTYLKFKTDNLDNAKPAFLLGGWVRITNPVDAFILAARADLSGFSVAFSYDVTMSKLANATSGNGGPELSVIYTGCIKRKSRSASYCPKL